MDHENQGACNRGLGSAWSPISHTTHIYCGRGFRICSELVPAEQSLLPPGSGLKCCVSLLAMSVASGPPQLQRLSSECLTGNECGVGTSSLLFDQTVSLYMPHNNEVLLVTVNPRRRKKCLSVCRRVSKTLKEFIYTIEVEIHSKATNSR